VKLLVIELPHSYDHQSESLEECCCSPHILLYFNDDKLLAIRFNILRFLLVFSISDINGNMRIADGALASSVLPP